MINRAHPHQATGLQGGHVLVVAALSAVLLSTIELVSLSLRSELASLRFSQTIPFAFALVLLPCLLASSLISALEAAAKRVPRLVLLFTVACQIGCAAWLFTRSYKILPRFVAYNGVLATSEILISCLTACLGFVPAQLAARRRGPFAHQVLSALCLAILITLYIELGPQPYIRLNMEYLTATSVGMVFLSVLVVRAFIGRQPPRRQVASVALLALLLVPLAAFTYQSKHFGRALIGGRSLVPRALMRQAAMGKPTSLVDPPAPPSQSNTARHPLPQKPRLVLFLSIDSLRADSAAQAFQQWLPNEMASMAVFNEATSTSSYTTPAVYGLMTGRRALNANSWPAIRITPDGRAHAESPGPYPMPIKSTAPTLAELLTKDGYRTSTCIISLAFAMGGGLSRGFQDIDTRALKGIRTEADTIGLSADSLIPCAREKLPQPGERAFLWLHFMDAHSPYHGDDPRRVKLVAGRRGYEGGVAFALQRIQELLAAIERVVPREETMLVLFADHGEEFAEHGSNFHGYSLYEETVHVPLAIRARGLPSGVFSGRISLIDILPTLAELLDLPAPPQLDGVSLVELLTKGTPLGPRPLVVDISRRERRVRGVVSEGWKLLFDDELKTWELYDLSRDPKEMDDRADSEPQRLKHLAGLAGVRLR